MIQNTISQYVYTLFDESRDGELTVGNDYNRFDYPVAWDEETAEKLAQQCGALIAHLTELAGRYDKLLTETRHLTREQMEVWNTYLRPFPEHDMDVDALRAIWEKEAIGVLPTREERKLSRQYDQWYDENALTRLPWKGCAPTDLISRARRYARLVQRNAPVSVQEYEARCLAEEFVLYHCMV